MILNPTLPTTINLIPPKCTTSNYSSSESDNSCRSDKDKSDDKDNNNSKSN